MRLPRFTTQRAMLLIALAGVALGANGMERRSSGFRNLARKHVGAALFNHMGSIDRIEHHRLMAEKYRQAARHPWLTVEPDPPEPE